MNADGKKEYFVQNIPADFVLLCAQAYAYDGSNLLFKDSGLVLRFSNEELVEVKQFIKNFHVMKQLTVRTQTYEVEKDHMGEEDADQNYCACAAAQVDTPRYVFIHQDTSTRSSNGDSDINDHSNQVMQHQLKGSGSHDANDLLHTEVANFSKVTSEVQVNNGTNRILAMLLTQLKLNALYLYVM